MASQKRTAKFLRFMLSLPDDFRLTEYDYGHMSSLNLLNDVARKLEQVRSPSLHYEVYKWRNTETYAEERLGYWRTIGYHCTFQDAHNIAVNSYKEGDDTCYMVLNHCKENSFRMMAGDVSEFHPYFGRVEPTGVIGKLPRAACWLECLQKTYNIRRTAQYCFKEHIVKPL